MMTQNIVSTVIRQSRLVAIIRLADLSEAIALSQALIDGGVKALEFTLTNRDSIAAIRSVKEAIPAFANGEAVIGAGTVVTLEDLDAVLEAGAQFIVSPVLKIPMIKACQDANIAVMPGAYTPTEILSAWEHGATFVKVFPARALGPSFVKDLLAALPALQLMPTGGVDPSNVSAYLSSGAAAVGVGGNLINGQRVAAHDWAHITATAREIMEVIRQVPYREAG